MLEKELLNLYKKDVETQRNKEIKNKKLLDQLQKY